MKRATLAGHSIHPMLIVFPLGLLVTSLVWDIVFLARGGDPLWSMMSFWTIVAGVVGGLAAALPGLIDYLAIPEQTRAKRIGLLHGLSMLSVVILFALSAVLRVAGTGYAYPTVGDMLPGWLGLALGVVGGWLGGELVERLGIGVSSYLDVNAPSSLRGDRPGKVREAAAVSSGPAL